MLTWAWVCLALYVVLTQTALLNYVILLVVLGRLPDGVSVIPAWIIFFTYPLFGLAAIAWLRRQPMYIGEVQATKKTRRRSKKQAAPAPNYLALRAERIRQRAVAIARRRPRIAGW